MKRVNVISMGVDLVNLDSAVGRVVQMAEGDTGAYVCVAKRIKQDTPKLWKGFKVFS